MAHIIISSTYHASPHYSTPQRLVMKPGMVTDNWPSGKCASTRLGRLAKQNISSSATAICWHNTQTTLWWKATEPVLSLLWSRQHDNVFTWVLAKLSCENRRHGTAADGALLVGRASIWAADRMWMSFESSPAKGIDYQVEEKVHKLQSLPLCISSNPRRLRGRLKQSDIQ